MTKGTAFSFDASSPCSQVHISIFLENPVFIEQNSLGLQHLRQRPLFSSAAIYEKLFKYDLALADVRTVIKQEPSKIGTVEYARARGEKNRRPGAPG